MLALQREQTNISEEELMMNIHHSLIGEPSIWFWHTFRKYDDRTFRHFSVALLERLEEAVDQAKVTTKASLTRYSGSVDVLAHVDKFTALMARGELPKKLQMEILRNSLTDEMQREIVLHEKSTIEDIVKMLRYANNYMCADEQVECQQ